MHNRFSRRGLLKTAAMLPALGAAQGGGRIVAYVGGSKRQDNGIHLFHFNPADGSLTPWKVFKEVPGPGWLAFHPNKKFLYAISSARFEGKRVGSVAAMAVDSATGDLKLINVKSSGGSGPAHLGLDPQGRFAFTANYGDGTTGVLPINSDGSLGDPVDVKKIEGPLGPQPAKNAPPGSFALSGHDAPHAHQARTDPSGRFLLVSDLGTDRVYVYRIDPKTGVLTPNTQPFVQAAPGDGPRNIDFAPNGRFVYSLNEEGSTVDMMTWNGETGALAIQQTLSTLPPGYAGTNYPSTIMVSRDGRFLYTANRLFDSIAIFSLDPKTGRMTAKGHELTRGSYPRYFGFDPSGKYMYVLHSQSDNITVFRVDTKSGRLTFTGKFYGVGSPSMIEFLTLS